MAAPGFELGGTRPGGVRTGRRHLTMLSRGKHTDILDPAGAAVLARGPFCT
jgi:hypothetical protein